MSKAVRTSRLGLRLTVEQRAAIVNAAKAENKDITTYLVERALTPPAPVASGWLSKLLGSSAGRGR
jgi:uncharacterized protein (DUF1778 family)